MKNSSTIRVVSQECLPAIPLGIGVLILRPSFRNVTRPAQCLEILTVERIASVVERLDMVALIPVRTATRASPVCSIQNLEAQRFRIDVCLPLALMADLLMLTLTPEPITFFT